MKKAFAAVMISALLLGCAGCKEAPATPTTAPTSGAFNSPLEDATIHDPDIPKRNNYTATDQQAIDASGQIVATMDGATLTNGRLQIYYWLQVYGVLDEHSDYLSYLNLDPSHPLSEQTFNEHGTWEHYFLDQALKIWQRYQAFAQMAKKEGITLDKQSQAILDNLRQSLEETARNAGYESAEHFLEADFGPGVTFEDYYTYQETYLLGYAYFYTVYQLASEHITEEMLETYYQQHAPELSQQGIDKNSGKFYSLRHLLILPDENTEACWENARAAAQELYDLWLQEGGSELYLAELARQYSDDDGSFDNGGLYEDLTTREGLDETFTAWFADPDRKTGDHDLIKTQHGYHIMYFLGSEEQWRYSCRLGIQEQMSRELTEDTQKLYPIETNYEAIYLGQAENYSAYSSTGGTQ